MHRETRYRLREHFEHEEAQLADRHYGDLEKHACAHAGLLARSVT
jgi:hemerythrin